MSVRETLLIVDDMEINRAILSTIFENDYNVIEAENGEEAISLLEKNQSSIAAMLLDLVMPVKSGFEVMEEMERRGYFYNIPVLVITSDDSSESERRAFDLGASDIIKKPFEPYAVKRRVKNVCGCSESEL